MVHKVAKRKIGKILNEETKVLSPKKEKKTDEIPPKYKGLIMVKKSPIFKDWKGVPLESVSHMDANEIIAVNPKQKEVEIMLRNGNLQFVSNQIRKTPTGDYPRIVEE